MRVPSERLFMRLIKGSIVGLVMAGILALAPTAVFAHGGGGGGGGHGGGGSGFGGGHGSGGGHFAGFAGHTFAGHSFAEHQGAHFAQHGDHFRHEGRFFFGDPFGYDYPYYGYDYPYYGDYDYNDDDYSDAQAFEQTVVAVQNELAKLGYYHGPVDGIVGPETQRAISWFQSVDKLSVTGRIDNPTLKALQIS
jgi:Putative peptidoglycan binding domain